MYNQFRSGILATEAQVRDIQVRRGLFAGSGQRIFRISREHTESRSVGRR